MKNLEKQQKCTTNDERQKREDNGNIDSVSERYRSHGMTGGTEKWPTKSARNDGRAAFTLVELVITIAIVIILSVISVPIYRGYVDKAKYSEGYALLGTILSAQKAYYSEYGNFLFREDGSASGISNNYTCNEPILGIDARGNKYFTLFATGHGDGGGRDSMKFYFATHLVKSEDLRNIDGKSCLSLLYNVTTGQILSEKVY